MNPFEMVVAIVIIACGAGVLNNWINARNKNPQPYYELNYLSMAMWPLLLFQNLMSWARLTLPVQVITAFRTMICSCSEPSANSWA